MNPPSRSMPPPPAIGSVPPRPKAKANEDEPAPRESGPAGEQGEPTDDSTTAQWPSLSAEIAQDDGPTDEPGSRSLPSISVRPPPSVGASSPSGLRVPSIASSSSSSGLRVPSIEPAAVSGPADSAGSWPTTDGWDLDDEPGSASVPSVAPLPKLDRTPKVTPRPKLGSVPQLGRLPKLTPLPKVSPLAAREELPSLEGSQGEAQPLFSFEPALTAPATDGLPPLEALASPELAPSPNAPSPLDVAPPWDPPQLLDAAPAKGVPDGVPMLDSAALLGMVAVEELDPAASSVPRLPLPGMMRDGPAPKAADFRAAPRPPRAQTAGAMAPLPGMVPPSFRDEDRPRPKPGDTASFVAQVAVELMQGETKAADEPASESAAVLGAQTEHERVVTDVAPVPKIVPMPLAAAREAPREAEGKRRGLMLGAAGLAAAIGLVIWLSSRGGDDEPTTRVAAAPAASEAKAEPLTPPPEATPPLDPPLVALAEGATTGQAPEAAEGEDPAGEGSGGEPALATSTGAQDEPEPEAEPEPEPEPEPEGADAEPNAPRKSSGKSKPSKGHSDAKPEPKTEPKPRNDAPSASKLLKQARSAYSAGKGSSAYGLASKANRMEPSGEAAEVMTLAACLMHDANKAKAALKNVPLLRRGSVRTTCKSKHDVRVGL